MSLKERIATIENYAGVVPKDDVLMLRSDAAYEALEIINQLQSIIKIQDKALTALDLNADQLKAFEEVGPCLLCGQDVKKIVGHVKEASEKTKKLMEEMSDDN